MPPRVYVIPELRARQCVQRDADGSVPSHQGAEYAEAMAQSIELCARVNDGLYFGCLEYGFAERTLMFRDSFPAPAGNVATQLPECSARILGSHFFKGVLRVDFLMVSASSIQTP